ncbi:MAG TPA: tetratricopeptide repeat protein [Chryseosolibacter sp.]
MKKHILTCLLVILSIGAFACLNGDSRELKSGYILFEDAKGNVIPYGHEFWVNELEDELLVLDSLYKSTKDIAYLSDYALVLIILKKYNEAIAIYLDIEKQFPGRYSTASNLGTAFELQGDNKKALQWIRKSVEIDPHAHQGSEWIHVKILETKVDGIAASTKDLLGVDFGEADGPYSALKEKVLLSMRSELYYQLNERISFVPAPDPIVATLMLAQGDLALLTGLGRDALLLYEKAQIYGSDAGLVSSRIVYAKKAMNGKLSKVRAPKQNLNGLYIAMAAISILFVCGVVVRIRQSND